MPVPQADVYLIGKRDVNRFFWYLGVTVCGEHGKKDRVHTVLYLRSLDREITSDRRPLLWRYLPGAVSQMPGVWQIPPGIRR